jgi:Leucine-rich repeat (LRR) protein
MSLTSYQDYIKLKKENRTLDDIYWIFIYNYSDYLKLKPIIFESKKLNSLFFYLRGKEQILSLDSAILLINQLPQIEKLYFNVQSLSCHLHNSKIKWLSLSFDTVNCNEESYDFSALDSLSTLVLNVRGVFARKIVFSNSMKELIIKGKNFSIDNFFKYAEIPGLERLQLSDDSLNDISADIKKYKKLKVLDITYTKIGKALNNGNPEAQNKADYLKQNIIPMECKIIYNISQPPDRLIK